MRPNVERIDGKWVSKSKAVLIASDEQEQIENALPGTHNTEVAGELESSFSTKDNTEDKTLTKISKNFMEQPTPTGESNASLSSKNKVKLETSNGNTSHSRPSKKLTEGNTVETPLSVTGDRLKDMPNETSCKDGTPRTGGTGTRFTKKIVIDYQPCAKSESPLTGATTVHLAISGISNMADEDQPLSTWIGGIHASGDEKSRFSSGKLVNGWNEERGLVDVPVESLAIDARGRSPLLDDDRSLPFVKKSPVWRTIESMDVFQILPQKPHFQPLSENRDEFREGSAIGIMVTFASLFEKISMLHFDDPRNTFGSILESLNDLEKHGFDVTFLRNRLNELLSIKEGQGQHLGERENAVKEIIENTKEVTKFYEEMEEIKRKISQLQERHTAIKSEKETKNLKISSLKLHVDVLNELIQNASSEFKKIATAPWKLP